MCDGFTPRLTHPAFANRNLRNSRLARPPGLKQSSVHDYRTQAGFPGLADVTREVDDLYNSQLCCIDD